MWYPKERGDLKMIHDENDDELVVARNFLKKSKHGCLYIRNEFPRGFCVKKKMTEEEKKITTREKHPERVAHGHKLAALMKKRKKILRDKEQSSVQSTVQPSVQPSVQSNDTYVYGVGILAVLASGVSVLFACNISCLKIKNSSTKNRINHQNDVICFRSYIINE